MEHTKLKLEKPKYEDQVVIELSGDYNDADYTYSTISMDVDTYEIVIDILGGLTGEHEWEDIDKEDIAVEALEKLGVEKSTPLYIKVMRVINDIDLYSDSGDSHTMSIDAVYFESKADSIRYIVN